MSLLRLDHMNKLQGNGFIVRTTEPGKCLVMTCEHVVRGLQTINVAFPNEMETTEATVLHSDKDADLAILRFDPKGHICVPLEFAELTTQLNSGTVYVQGYYHLADGGRPLAPGKHRARIIGDPKDGRIFCNYVSTDGLSGAPVTMEGRVVGVHSMMTESVKVSVSVVTVWETLQKWLDIDDKNIGIDDMLKMIALT